jgi:large subunit ribosomal protein L13
MIVDATDMIAGRLAAIVARKALLGEKIEIVNAEKAVITGRREAVFADFEQLIRRTVPLKGPYVPRGPDRLLRRIIRGMLPHHQSRGREAFERIMCWRGVPPIFQGQKMEVFKEAKIDKLRIIKFVTIYDISKHIGGKVE